MSRLARSARVDCHTSRLRSGSAHEVAIVLDHHRAVGVLLDIELDPVGAVGDAALEGRYGVFGRHRGAAAVGDDLRGVHPVGVINSQREPDDGQDPGRNPRGEDQLAGDPERCAVGERARCADFGPQLTGARH